MRYSHHTCLPLTAPPPSTSPLTNAYLLLEALGKTWGTQDRTKGKEPPRTHTYTTNTHTHTYHTNKQNKHKISGMGMGLRRTRDDEKWNGKGRDSLLTTAPAPIPPTSRPPHPPSPIPHPPFPPYVLPYSPLPLRLQQPKHKRTHTPLPPCSPPLLVRFHRTSDIFLHHLKPRRVPNTRLQSRGEGIVKRT